MQNNIEQIIREELAGDDQTVAHAFVAYLQKNQFAFYRDESDCWKNKIYFWVKYRDACVCFIAIKDPDEPENRWTVWSEDIDSAYLNDNSVDEKRKQTALNNVDKCGHCGSCGGGKTKVIFGKTFDAVCGCTFRFDNPQIGELPCIEYMIEAAIKQINNHPDTTFRHAKTGEAPQIHALYKSVIGTPFCVWNEFYPGMDEIRHDMETGNLYVLLHRDTVIGALSVVPENELDDLSCWQHDGREIARVVVAKDWQGCGLAYRMVQETEMVLKKQNCHAIHLSVVKSNIPAYKTYDKAGFQVVGEAELYGGQYWLMEKEI